MLGQNSVLKLWGYKFCPPSFFFFWGGGGGWGVVGEGNFADLLRRCLMCGWVDEWMADTEFYVPFKVISITLR